MSAHGSYSGRIAVRASSDRAGPGVGEVHVGRGTVFVRPAVLAEPTDSVQLDTDFHGPWLVVTNGLAKEVERGPIESDRSPSVNAVVQASAFGCDSKVLERAVRRLLESAAENGLDSIEITELSRRQDSGLEYVSIVARCSTTHGEPALGPVGQGVRPAIWQPEG
jgi:hypothetical protein